MFLKLGESTSDEGRRVTHCDICALFTGSSCLLSLDYNRLIVASLRWLGNWLQGKQVVVQFSNNYGWNYLELFQCRLKLTLCECGSNVSAPQLLKHCKSSSVIRRRADGIDLTPGNSS